MKLYSWYNKDPQYFQNHENIQTQIKRSEVKSSAPIKSDDIQRKVNDVYTKPSFVLAQSS